MESVQLKAPPITASNQLKLLRIKQVQAETGLCKSQIYLLQSKENFPSSVSLSAEPGKRGAVAWLDHEVQAWIEGRVRASRDNAGGA